MSNKSQGHLEFKTHTPLQHGYNNLLNNLFVYSDNTAPSLKIIPSYVYRTMASYLKKIILQTINNIIIILSTMMM